MTGKPVHGDDRHGAAADTIKNFIKIDQHRRVPITAALTAECGAKRRRRLQRQSKRWRTRPMAPEP